MRRFCYYDGCKIPDERRRRGSRFGSDVCFRASRIEERAEKAKEDCRLCGRPINGRFAAMVKVLKIVAKGKISQVEMVGLARTAIERMTKEHASKPVRKK